ncbi:p-loop containing nucleoside triphosphate hydrolase protein [Mycena sanguinolenta]|uniref:p-loop containing nucleoside triphosphate hydrolase protein n=1 Tax=Mycena sanguinolenta TaxID=230812 RepID=A0A8H7CSC8_9AGAR|nr:p-loop containing nucleoside triphosphate hydrolase protein [Mycena sanguinolenta]
MRSGTAWTLDNFTVTRYPEGGESSLPLNIRKFHPMLLVGGSATAQLQRWRDEKVVKEKELQDANAALRTEQEQYNAAKRQQDRLTNEVNEETPASLAAIQEAKRTEDEREFHMKQLQELTKQLNELDETQKGHVAERDRLTAEINDFQARKEEVKVKIDKAVGQRTEHQGAINHYKGKLTEGKEAWEKAKEAVSVVEQEFENWTEQAEEYCEEVPANRTVDEVKRNLEATQAALREREKRHGASVEDMTVEMNKAREKLEKAENDLKQMTSLNKALKASLIVRLSRWQEFPSSYRSSLQARVLFDHEKGTLQLRVKTDDQVATKGGRDKDPRSLSGGEKSFSTICLLLSLWESIGCPLRCLDEFDVFVDAVNRRISMKMMIETANTSDKKQYVLITPQDMNNVVIGPTVRVHRMTDPERGQGVLGFGQ